ncbi:hypothetical protein K7X08_037506 [Anisodus acutangulus]|uniref:Uncharacterized protein n=1 Tax=Anisodus acutangulus TaxID=402998 RepID=A0A9Q1MWN8_9SOLA|nr:hypothetical protein K7X08_037506 [Anisodus acutangulus]
MLESMKDKVGRMSSMYRCDDLPLTFQCWFYECCGYADKSLPYRMGDSVSRILNWSVKKNQKLNNEVVSLEEEIKPSFKKIFKALNIKDDSKIRVCKVDDLPDPSDVVDEGMKGNDHVGDNEVDECMKVGDDAGKISGDEEVDTVVKSVTETILDDQVIDDAADECIKVGDNVDWSTVPNVEFSKFSQFGSVKNNKARKEVSNVVKGMTEAMKKVGTEKL